MSGSRNETIRLWEVTSGQCRAVVGGVGSTIQSIACTASDINCFVIGCDDGSVRMWQVVENDDVCHVRLRWRFVNGSLDLSDTLIQDVHGLSQGNKQLFNVEFVVGSLQKAGRETTDSGDGVSIVCSGWVESASFMLALWGGQGKERLDTGDQDVVAC